MDNAIIFQVLGVLLALFFIFLTYMNTKTWKWVHVTFTFLVFAASIVFCLYASLALKTRAAWIETHDRLEKQVADVKKQLDLVTNGDPTDPARAGESLVSLRAELARAIIDRGRVWRQCTVATADQNTITLSTAPPADPNAPAPAGAPQKNNIEVKTVLYAFKEADLAGNIVPSFYLGEFQATAVTDTTVTLTPTMPLWPDQVAAVGQPGTWVLYDVAPVDGHEFFAGLDAAALSALIPQNLTGLPPDQYQKLIAQYVKDGQQADEVNDPPENIWMEVTFKQAYKVPVDAPALNSVDSVPFNTDGQAQFDRLRRAAPGKEPESVEFAPGDTATFDLQTANDLISQGIATKVRPIYRRQLIDFDKKFTLIHARMVELQDRLASLKQDLDSIVASTAKADEQIKLLTDYKTKLEADQAKVAYELAEITKYSGALSSRLGDVQGQLSVLYRSNKALSRELDDLNTRLTNEINRRTREATAMSR